MKTRFVAALILVVSIAGLQGCTAWFSASTPTWPWVGENPSPCQAICTDNDAIKAFAQANTYCRDLQNYYEAGGLRAKSNQMTVGLVGSLAGAVAAPLANGDAAKAWSGLSGATNAVQASMEEAFSTTVSTKRRKAIADEADAASKIYAGKTTANDKVVAALDMARVCAMGSAKADAAALKALTE